LHLASPVLSSLDHSGEASGACAALNDCFLRLLMSQEISVLLFAQIVRYLLSITVHHFGAAS
jgi:hypothetical protein